MMIELIEELETALRHLREECIARGVTPSMSISYYGDDIENKEQIYTIGDSPKKLKLYDLTFAEFVENLFTITTIKKSACHYKTLAERNQRVINLDKL